MLVDLLTRRIDFADSASTRQRQNMLFSALAYSQNSSLFILKTIMTTRTISDNLVSGKLSLVVIVVLIIKGDNTDNEELRMKNLFKLVTLVSVLTSYSSQTIRFLSRGMEYREPRSPVMI